MNAARALSCLLAGRLRIAAALLWFAATGLAVFAGTAALLRTGAGRAAPFAAVAAGGIILGAATLAGRRWALAVTLLGAAGQPVAVAASAWELIDGIPAQRTGNLRAIGVDPTLGVTINLVYSLAASAVAGWALARLLTTCRQPRPAPPT
jgi:hypothetical protein